MKRQVEIERMKDHFDGTRNGEEIHYRLSGKTARLGFRVLPYLLCLHYRVKNLKQFAMHVVPVRLQFLMVHE